MTLNEVKNKIKTVEGWLSDAEVEFLYGAARSCSGKGVIVEIGSWQGKSTVCLAGASEAGSRVQIYAIDPHQDSYVHEDFWGKGISTFGIFKKNIESAGISSLVHPIVSKSEEAVRGWNKPIEFLWIDGDHRYNEVKKDFDLWSPFVVDGGIIAFHDSSYDDVQEFVIKEVLLNKNFKNAVFTDSITAVSKTSHRGLAGYLRAVYVIFLNKTQGFFRKMPMPGFLRRGIKNAGKKFINYLGRAMNRGVKYEDNL